MTDLSILNGKTIKNIHGLFEGSDGVTITTKDGNSFRFYHDQDCCETVSLCDYEADTEDFSGAKIILAEEVSDGGPNHLIATLKRDPIDSSESFTWTFYKISTNKGDLWMRWLGESNGYYSESVSFIQINTY